MSCFIELFVQHITDFVFFLLFFIVVQDSVGQYLVWFGVYFALVDVVTSSKWSKSMSVQNCVYSLLQKMSFVNADIVELFHVNTVCFLVNLFDVSIIEKHFQSDSLLQLSNLVFEEH
jgi:hypothetical protein